MGIWVVGPSPDFGQCMPIDTHALTTLFHPQQIDKEASLLDKRFCEEVLQVRRPDPECFVELDMRDCQKLGSASG